MSFAWVSTIINIYLTNEKKNLRIQGKKVPNFDFGPNLTLSVRFWPNESSYPFNFLNWSILIEK